jgi:hypothetical protein
MEQINRNLQNCTYALQDNESVISNLDNKNYTLTKKIIEMKSEYAIVKQTLQDTEKRYNELSLAIRDSEKCLLTNLNEKDMHQLRKDKLTKKIETIKEYIIHKTMYNELYDKNYDGRGNDKNPEGIDINDKNMLLKLASILKNTPSEISSYKYCNE